MLLAKLTESSQHLDEALEVYEMILKRKDDASLYQEVARTYLKKSKFDRYSSSTHLKEAEARIEVTIIVMIFSNLEH